MLLSAILSHFGDKVDAAVGFALSATDSVIVTDQRGEIAESLLGSVWWNLLQLDESFRIDSHLQVFEQLAIADWPLVARCLANRMGKFRHDESFFQLASPRAMVANVASLTLYVRAFMALVSRFGMDRLPAGLHRVLNQLCRDKVRLPPTGLGNSPAVKLTELEFPGRRVEEHSRRASDVQNTLKRATELYGALCRELVFVLDDSLAVLFGAVHSLKPAVVIQEIANLLQPNHHATAVSSFDRRPTRTRSASSPPAVSRSRVGSGGGGGFSGQQAPIDSFVAAAAPPSILSMGSSSSSSSPSTSSWALGINSYNSTDRNYGGYSRSQVLLVYLAKYLQFNLKDENFVRQDLCGFLQALLNSLEKTVHRDLQFAELHALQGVLQQLDFQQTSTQDGSWGVLALHADRARALCLTLAREVGELKAVSLQVVATIIMHSRELQFRSHFYEFLRKRAVRHLDQPKKAYHSLEILRTVVCGGNVVNDRALRLSQLVFSQQSRRTIFKLVSDLRAGIDHTSSRRNTAGGAHGVHSPRRASEGGSDGDDEGDGEGVSAPFGDSALNDNASDSEETEEWQGPPRKPQAGLPTATGSLRSGHARIVPDFVVTANLRMRRNLGSPYSMVRRGHGDSSGFNASHSRSKDTTIKLQGYLAELTAWTTARRPLKAQQATQLIAPVSSVVTDIFFQVAAHDLKFFRQRIFNDAIFGANTTQHALGATLRRREDPTTAQTARTLSKNLLVFQSAVQALRRVADPGSRFCSTVAIGNLDGPQCVHDFQRSDPRFNALWSVHTHDKDRSDTHQQLKRSLLAEATYTSEAVQETAQGILTDMQARNFFDLAYEYCGVSTRHSAGTNSEFAGASSGSGSMSGSSHGTGTGSFFGGFKFSGGGVETGQPASDEYDALIFSHYDDAFPPNIHPRGYSEHKAVAAQRKRWFLRLQSILRTSAKVPGNYKGNRAALLDALVAMERLKACMFCPSTEILEQYSLRRQQQHPVASTTPSPSKSAASAAAAANSPTHHRMHAWFACEPEGDVRNQRRNSAGGIRSQISSESLKTDSRGADFKAKKKVMQFLPQIELLYFPHWRLATAVSHTFQKIALESDSRIVEECVIQTFIASILRHAVRSDVQQVVAAVGILTAIVLRLPSQTEVTQQQAASATAGTTPRRRPTTVLGRPKWYFKVEALCLTLFVHASPTIRKLAFRLASALAKDGNSTSESDGYSNDALEQNVGETANDSPFPSPRARASPPRPSFGSLGGADSASGSQNFDDSATTVRGYRSSSLWQVLRDKQHVILRRAKLRLQRHCSVHKLRHVAWPSGNATIKDISDTADSKLPLRTVDDFIENPQKVWWMVRVELVKCCHRHLSHVTIRRARAQLWSWMSDAKVNCYNFADLRHFHGLASSLAQEHSALYRGSSPLQSAASRNTDRSAGAASTNFSRAGPVGSESTSAPAGQADTSSDSDKTSDGLFHVFRHMADHAAMFFALTTCLYSLYEIPASSMQRLRQNTASAPRVSGGRTAAAPLSSSGKSSIHSPTKSARGNRGAGSGGVGDQNANADCIGADNPINADTSQEAVLLFLFRDLLRGLFENAAEHHVVELQWTRFAFEASFSSACGSPGIAALGNEGMSKSAKTCLSVLDMEEARHSMRWHLPAPRLLHPTALFQGNDGRTLSAPTADPSYYNAMYALYWQGLIHEMLTAVDRSASGLVIQLALKWGSPVSGSQYLNANISRVSKVIGGRGVSSAGSGTSTWSWESSLTDIRYIFGSSGKTSSLRGSLNSGFEVRQFPTLTVAAGSTIVGVAGTLEAYHQRLMAATDPSLTAKSSSRIQQKHYMVLGERAVAETLMRFVLSYTQTRAFVRDFFQSSITCDIPREPTSTFCSTSSERPKQVGHTCRELHVVDSDDNFDKEVSSRRQAEAAARLVSDFAVLDKFLLEHAWQRLPQAAGPGGLNGVPASQGLRWDTLTGRYEVDAADLRYSVELVTTLAALATNHRVRVTAEPSSLRRASRPKNVAAPASKDGKIGVGVGEHSGSLGAAKSRSNKDALRRTDLQTWSFRTRNTVWWRISSCRRCSVAGVTFLPSVPVAVPGRQLLDYCYDGTQRSSRRHALGCDGVTLVQLQVPGSLSQLFVADSGDGWHRDEHAHACQGTGRKAARACFLKQPRLPQAQEPAGSDPVGSSAAAKVALHRRLVHLHLRVYEALARFQLGLIAAAQALVHLGPLRPASDPLPQSTKLAVASDICWILAVETHGHRNILAPYVRANWKVVSVLITVFYLFLAKAAHNTNFRAHAAEILLWQATSDGGGGAVANRQEPHPLHQWQQQHGSSHVDPSEAAREKQRRQQKADSVDLFVVADSHFEVYSFVDAVRNRRASSPSRRTQNSGRAASGSTSNEARAAIHVDADSWSFGRNMPDMVRVENDFSRPSLRFASTQSGAERYQFYFPSKQADGKSNMQTFGGSAFTARNVSSRGTSTLSGRGSANDCVEPRSARESTELRVFQAEANVMLILRSLSAGLRKAHSQILHQHGRNVPTTPSSGDEAAPTQRAVKLPQNFETLLFLSLLCIGPSAPRAMRSTAYSMVATLVFIAVATGAADDTVDLEIGVAGAYPGQAPITLEAFASRSFGGLGNGNTAIPSASPAVSPATLEEQTAMEDFPNVPEEDPRLMSFRIVIHHLHRLAVKSETVAPNVAELIAREACRVLALVLRNRAPQFLTEYFRRVQAFPFLRGQYLKWGLRILLPWCESAAQRIKGVHVSTDSNDFSNHDVLSPGNRAVHLRNFTLDREIPLHADTLMEMEVQSKQAQGHALALEPFWLMSCAVLEQQRDFVPPPELIRIWVVLAQVRTVSLVDTSGSLAVLRYLIGKVESIHRTPCQTGQNDERNAGSSATHASAFCPSPPIVCRLAREIMTAISMSLFPQIPSIVVESLMHPLAFTFRTEAQAQQDTKNQPQSKAADPSFSSTASSSSTPDTSPEKQQQKNGPQAFGMQTEDWSAGGKFHLWYRLLLEVNPICEAATCASDSAQGQRAAGSFAHSIAPNAKDPSVAGLRDVPVGSVVPATIVEDSEVEDSDDSSSTSDESRMLANSQKDAEGAGNRPVPSSDSMGEVSVEQAKREAVQNVQSAAAVALRSAGNGTAWAENAALRSVLSSVLGELVTVMPEGIFREHLPTLCTFVITTLVVRNVAIPGAGTLQSFNTFAEQHLLLAVLRRLAINAIDHLQTHRITVGLLGKNRDIMGILDLILHGFQAAGVFREQRHLRMRMGVLLKLEEIVASLDVLIAEKTSMKLGFHNNIERTQAFTSGAGNVKKSHGYWSANDTDLNAGFDMSVQTVVDAILLLGHLQETDYRIVHRWVEVLCEWISKTRNCPAVQVPCIRLLDRVHRGSVLYPSTSSISDQNFAVRAESLFLQALLVEATMRRSQSRQDDSELRSGVEYHALIESLARACKTIVEVWVRKSQMWDTSNVVLSADNYRGVSEAPGVGNNNAARRHRRHQSGIPGSGVDARCFVAYFWTTVALVDHAALDVTQHGPQFQQLTRSMLLHIFQSDRLRALLDERHSLDTTLWDYARISSRAVTRGAFALLGKDAGMAASVRVSPEKYRAQNTSEESLGSYASDSSSASENDAENIWAVDGNTSFKPSRKSSGSYRGARPSKQASLRDAAGLFVSCVDKALRLSACHCRTPDVELLLLAGKLTNNQLAGAPRVLVRRILVTTLLLPLLGSMACTCKVPRPLQGRAGRLVGSAASIYGSDFGPNAGWGLPPRIPSADFLEEQDQRFSPDHYRGGGSNSISRNGSNRFAALGIDLGLGDDGASVGSPSRKSSSSGGGALRFESSATVAREHALLSIMSDFFSEDSASVAFDLARILKRCTDAFFGSTKHDQGSGGQVDDGLQQEHVRPGLLPPVFTGNARVRSDNAKLAGNGQKKNADYRPWLIMFAECVGEHYPVAAAPCMRVLLMYVKAVCRIHNAGELNPSAIDVRGAIAVEMICALLEALQRRDDFEPKSVAGAVHDMLTVFGEILSPSHSVTGNASAGDTFDSKANDSQLLRTYETILHSLSQPCLAAWEPLKADDIETKNGRRLSHVQSLFSFAGSSAGSNAGPQRKRGVAIGESGDAVDLHPPAWSGAVSRAGLKERFTTIFSVEVHLLRQFEEMADWLPRGDLHGSDSDHSNRTSHSGMGDAHDTTAHTHLDSDDSLAFLRVPQNSGGSSSSSDSESSNSSSNSRSSSSTGSSIHIPNYDTFDPSMQFDRNAEIPLPPDTDEGSDIGSTGSHDDHSDDDSAVEVEIGPLESTPTATALFHEIFDEQSQKTVHENYSVESQFSEGRTSVAHKHPSMQARFHESKDIAGTQEVSASNAPAARAHSDGEEDANQPENLDVGSESEDSSGESQATHTDEDASLRVAMATAPPLEAVLRRSEQQEFLYRFMDNHFDTCMIDFYNAVIEYEASFEHDVRWQRGDSGPAKRRAQAVVKRFIKLDAFDTLDDLDEEVRDEILAAVDSPKTTREGLMSIFNMAKACIINSIESDVYREFVKSNDYRQMQTLQDAAHK